MTEEESITLVSNYFNTHGLDLSKTTIDNDGNIHLVITPESFQHIPLNVKNELDNRYKLFVRIGYSGNARNHGIHPGSYLLIDSVVSIPKHWYCDDNEDPLPDTDSSYMLFAVNPSYGTAFKQSQYLLYNNRFSNVDLWKGIDQNIANGSYSFGQFFTCPKISSFTEWRNLRLSMDGASMRNAWWRNTNLYSYRFTMCIIAQIVFSSSYTPIQRHIAYFASPICQWETTEGLINENPPQWKRI